MVILIVILLFLILFALTKSTFGKVILFLVALMIGLGYVVVSATDDAVRISNQAKALNMSVEEYSKWEQATKRAGGR